MYCRYEYQFPIAHFAHFIHIAHFTHSAHFAQLGLLFFYLESRCSQSRSGSVPWFRDKGLDQRGPGEALINVITNL
ncbi:hypothetical protein BpHYR1_036442 [Brachionus plicatilis]|uniref:Uncharacterized protein n=1 Tax=Brachionus plicatilis TaxID=10195 RepID=A0A3M7PZS4_BRAPC|nr:hypothetical protein BpHYR1_036442 [Brachionus plicatilis]